MSTKISDQDQKWLDEINKLSEEGISIAKRSSMESRQNTRRAIHSQHC